MARNSVCKKSFVIDGSDAVCSWEFADGKKVELDLADLPDSMYLRAAVHGILQKGGDSYSNTPNPGPARAQLEATLAALQDGDWNRRADASGILVEALVKVTGQPMDAVVERLRSMDDKAKKELAKHPQMKVAIKKIELERAEAKVDGKEAADMPLDF